jgi:hypothetical protein
MERLESLAASVAAYCLGNWKYAALVATFIGLMLLFKGTRDVVKAFFGFHEHEGASVKAKKVFSLTIGRVVYAAADYWVAILLGTIVVMMSAYNCSYVSIILVTWIYDFVFAVIFWAASERSGNDFTFGKAYRRAGDKMNESQNRIVGMTLFVLTVLWVSFKAIVWDGPESIVIFFKNELKTTSRVIVALEVLAGIQSLFGAWLYTSVYDLWSNLF